MTPNAGPGLQPDIVVADDLPTRPSRAPAEKSPWEKSRDRMTITLLVIALATVAAVWLAADEILSDGAPIYRVEAR